MLEVQRAECLREGEEGCNPLASPDESIHPEGCKPAERSVSFNRDVHVKRIGRGVPRVTAALVGDGEGRLIATPVHKESIASRSKEDLAQEAALVLQQADSLHCVAHDGRLPGRFSTLPARRNKKRPELLDVRRRSVDSELDLETPKSKKKALERSASDASAKKLKGLSRLFSPKLERKRSPVTRSVSDAGARAHRKRSGSESDSHLGSRAKKQLSPIIEASPRVDQQPFHFDQPRESKPKPSDVDKVDGCKVRRIPIEIEPDMLRNSRYEDSTIHKMIHRLSSDRSPPPQLTRTMVAPAQGFGHNNNRPFSYTRPNESSQDVIYAQVQTDKKKAQRSHSDSDEGLGLERKDSSRENSPAEKEYRRTEYSYNDINSFGGHYDCRALYEKPEKYTSTVFVDASERPSGISSKTSELSARRDLLESRIKSRLLADEMFAAKNSANVPIKKSEHEIIDKPIVPSPVTPNRVSSPKRYTDTYITETRTNSNGEKYIFEKEIHEDNGKVYGYEKKINKIPSDGFVDTKPRDGYTVETRTDKYGDKYLVETRTHEGYSKPLRPSPDRYQVTRTIHPEVHRFRSERKFSKSDDFLDRDLPKKGSFEKGMSKSTQRLDEVGSRLRSEYTSRSHENLTSHDYVNARDVRRTPKDSPFAKRHLDSLREGPNDEYDTDISQLTSQLESKYFKETRTTQRYTSQAHEDYDSSPPRIRTDRGGYNSSRYDSDTTARDSVRCETRYDERTLRKEHRKDEDPKKPLRRSRNRLDYFDDSDIRVNGVEPFDESPPRPPRAYEGKSRHARQETRTHTERRHRETRLSDSDRKDRLADSGIENDYRRDSQEVDRREQIESEDEGFVTRQFIKNERRHTDRNMNKYEASKTVTAKPPSGADKKYEKKVTKKSGTMSKVKQLFSKKEKKAKEEKSKKGGRGSGAFTDDEVTMRYREYRGDQLRSAKSARDLGSDINQEEYSQRRRLSTPSGSPSPPRPARLSRSTGTLTREEESFHESSNTLTRENQGQEAERKGWFKSLSRKNKSSTKTVDKKPRIPESEILTTGTEDEEASSAPERVSVQKNLRFFGDTDQESVSSNRDRRNKRADDHAISRRDVTNSSRHNLGILSPSRKPPMLAESALSSGESTTGDSSQQSQNSQRSQRSVVYLHAATVGEIPGPNERRKAASREELNRPLQSHTRTVSRSVSVLAPWKPRHYREPYEINYDQQLHTKPVATMRRRQRSRETLSRRGKDPRRSKDNLSKTGTINRSTLKSKDKQKVDRTVSTESLSSKSRSAKPELSRSTSVPRDPNKTAGWFKLKSKKSRA